MGLHPSRLVPKRARDPQHVLFAENGDTLISRIMLVDYYGPVFLQHGQPLEPLFATIERVVEKVETHTDPDAEHAPPTVKKYVRFGASPRAGQAIIIGAKVQALMNGRFNVAFSDIEAVSLHALRHRLILNFEGEAEGIQVSAIVTDILQLMREAQAVS